ncbi:hypothetical protein V5799_023420 [Amblyomma americanum]|uniref:Uncharacterized protein n=1 Tax=Amblyomma americanum TaxID=6943 RepID=A0AAQ4FJB6_AMBAM
MEMDVDLVLAQARKKIREIQESRIDLGIRKQLMLCLLLQERSRIRPTDAEEFGGGEGEEKCVPEGADEKSATRNSFNKESKFTKRLREESQDEHLDSKKFTPNRTCGDEQEVGASGRGICAVAENPIVMGQKTADSTNEKKERKDCPAEKELMDWSLLYDDNFDLPDYAAAPDLSFLGQ